MKTFSDTSPGKLFSSPPSRSSLKEILMGALDARGKWLQIDTQ